MYNRGRCRSGNEGKEWVEGLAQGLMGSVRRLDRGQGQGGEPCCCVKDQQPEAIVITSGFNSGCSKIFTEEGL